MSAGPSGSREGEADVSEALGRASFASCLVEQPPSSAVATASPATMLKLRRRTVVLPEILINDLGEVTQVRNALAAGVWTVHPDSAPAALDRRCTAGLRPSRRAPSGLAARL